MSRGKTLVQVLYPDSPAAREQDQAMITIDIHETYDDDGGESEWIVSDDGEDFDDEAHDEYLAALDDAESRVDHYVGSLCQIKRDGLLVSR